MLHLVHLFSALKNDEVKVAINGATIASGIEEWGFPNCKLNFLSIHRSAVRCSCLSTCVWPFGRRGVVRLHPKRLDSVGISLTYQKSLPKENKTMKTMLLNFGTTAIVAIAMTLFSVGNFTSEVNAAEDALHADHMLKCAAVCNDCQIQCDVCFAHCATMVNDGKKDHFNCMNACLDCAECCKTCSTLCARKSPLCGAMSVCCVKSCEECAAACEKFPDDKQLAKCAKACRVCIKECSAMAQMMK